MATTYELIVKATDRSSGPLGRINKSINNTEKASKRLTASMKTVGVALAGIFTGTVVKSIVSTTAKFEDFRDTLNSVTGSAKEGGKAFKGIQSFATRTQFSVDELTNAYIKLAGAGIKPTEKLLTTFTDTAAVTTDQVGTLTAMSDLFSRTLSGGLGLEELNRLADRGVPVFRILEEQLGLTRLEVGKFGKTTEGAEKIRNALVKGLDKSFGGATQGKLDNLSTAMSNFGIAVTLAANKIGEEFRPQLTAAINDATKFIETNDALLKSLGTNLGQALVTTGQSVQFLAKNIDTIRNAALAYMGVRLLANFQGTAAAAAKLSGGSGKLGTRLAKLGSALSKSSLGRAVLIFGNLGTLMGNLGKKTLGLIPKFAKAGLAIIRHMVNPMNLLKLRFLATLHPVGRLAVMIGTVLAGAVSFVKGSVERALGTVVTFSEFGIAAFQLLGTTIQNVGTFLKQTFKDATSSITNWFSGVFDDLGRGFQKMGELAKSAANFLMNGFLVAAEFITGLFRNLPGFFRGAMRAVKELGMEAVNSLVNGFAALGPALKQAIELDFAGALETVSKGFAADFSGAIARGMADAPSLIPQVDAAAIMGVDRVDQVVDIFTDKIKPLRIAINRAGVAAFEAAEDGIRPLTDALAENILKNREAEQAAALKAHRDIETAHAASFAADSIDEVNIKTKETAAVLPDTTSKLALLDAAYKQLFKDIKESNQESEIQVLLIARLNKELAAGLLTIDQYAAGMAKINEQMGVTEPKTFSGKLMQAEQKIFDSRAAEAERTKLRESLKASGRFTNEEIISAGFMDKPEKEKPKKPAALQALTDRITEQKKAYDSLNISTEEQKRIADELGISYSDFNEQLKQSMSGMEMFKTEAQLFAEEMQEGFKKAGESLSQNLARDLIKGRNVLDSFKNFFDNILEQMLQAVIQKAIMQPLLDSIMGGMGGGMGGGGGFNPLSMVMGLFKAEGGAVKGNSPYIVGEKGPELFMPGTTGRVIPNNEMGSGSGGTPVTFQIQALDSKAGTEFILENKNKIINMINSAQRQRGKMGIMD